MKRLLIVEHNRLFRSGLALLLEWRTGLSSVYASSLAEAQDVLDGASEMPICTIVDLDLPKGDSTELLKQLNELPVVALIKGPSLARRTKALEEGADEVVEINTIQPGEQIIAAVERLIGPRSISAF